MSTDSSKEQLAALNLNIGQIMKLLPHRYPFLMVDRVTELVPKEYINAYKNVTVNEPFFQGHFPGAPVMPGVLIVEGMAQAAGLLVLNSEPIDVVNNLFLFTSMDNVKFRKPVKPGDRIDMHATIIRNKMNIWKMDCKARVDGNLAAEGVLTAAIVQREALI